MYPWLKAKPDKPRTPALSTWSVSTRRIKPSCHNCAYRERLTQYCTKRQMYVVDRGMPKYPHGCFFWMQHKTTLSKPDGSEILDKRRRHKGRSGGRYRCLRCGSLTSKFPCPYCQSKMMEKVRKPKVRTVQAI